MYEEKKKTFGIWPTDEEYRYFKANKITPNDFFHQAFKWMQNGERYSWIKDMTGMLLIMIMGVLLFCIAFLAFNLYLQVLLVIIGLFMAVFGTVSIWCEWRRHGRFHHTTS